LKECQNSGGRVRLVGLIFERPLVNGNHGLQRLPEGTIGLIPRLALLLGLQGFFMNPCYNS